jgi:hypothetical protein
MARLPLTMIKDALIATLEEMRILSALLHNPVDVG